MRDGSALHADIVLIGIGIAPNVELASASGLQSTAVFYFKDGSGTNFPDTQKTNGASEKPGMVAKELFTP